MNKEKEKITTFLGCYFFQNEFVNDWRGMHHAAKWEENLALCNWWNRCL